MSLLPKTITAPVGRIGTAAQNALEVARFGGLTTDDEPSPYEVAHEQRVFRLRRYFPPAGTPPAGTPQPARLAKRGRRRSCSSRP